MLQGFAALLVLTGASIGAAVTLRQVRATREGQVTDRYTKAVDQLGSEHLDVRLGGIYALERIARDSTLDRATIEEVLTTYVRGHAPWPSPSPSPLVAITQVLVAFAKRQGSPWQRWITTHRVGDDQQELYERVGATSWSQRPDVEPHRLAADVQAAVTVLGRSEPPGPAPRQLDLARVDLRYARLYGANLQGAMLHEANLQGAMLERANLIATSLNRTNLQGARLRRAMLSLAKLPRANLQGAQLEGATLQDAWLAGANLAGANLEGARLHDANLDGARLDGANLRGAWANEYTRWPTGWDRTTAKARGFQYSD